MTRDEILRRIGEVLHTDRTWRRIRRDVERDQIDEAEARRYLVMHTDRLMNGDTRSEPFVPLWQAILDLSRAPKAKPKQKTRTPKKTVVPKPKPKRPPPRG